MKNTCKTFINIYNMSKMSRTSIDNDYNRIYVVIISCLADAGAPTFELMVKISSQVFLGDDISGSVRAL